MVKKADLLSFSSFITNINELLDSEPECIEEYETWSINVPNPDTIGYIYIWEIWVYERFVRIKFRDTDQLIEYQLDLLPWNMSLNYNIWNDSGIGSSIVVFKQHIKFTDTEEEYFQRMTQQDNSFFTMEELGDAKILMNRIYEYFKITKVPQEK